MSQNKIQEAKQFYDETIRGFMLNDLKKSIEAKTNFLTALGCLIYTEVIGAFLPVLNNEKGKTEERKFYRCLFRLHSKNYLKNLDENFVQETQKGIYKNLRHSMTHKYSPQVSKRKDGVTLFIPSVVARDGITTSDRSKTAPPIFVDKQGKVVIATKNFFNELSEAVDGFYRKTFKDKDSAYQTAVIKGVDFILRGKRS